MSEETKSGDLYMTGSAEVVNRCSTFEAEGYPNEHDYWLSCISSNDEYSSTPHCPSTRSPVVDGLVISMEGTQEAVGCNKRERRQELWKANLKKLRVNSGQPYVTETNQQRPQRFVKKVCGVACKQQCSYKISKEQQVAIHTAFWNLADHGLQRNFIYKNCTRLKPKYRYTKDGSNRGYNVIYNLTVNGEDFRVCKMFFMNTLDIGEKFIRNTFKKVDEETGVLERDRRGLHIKHQIKDSLKEGVRNHIKSFPKLDVRGKTNRQYLPGNLSVARMYRLYTEEMKSGGLPMVKQSMYSKIFNTEFMLAFFTHKKDRCNICKTYRDASAEKKAEMQGRYDAHLRNNANRCLTKPEVVHVQKSSSNHEAIHEVPPSEFSRVNSDSDMRSNHHDSMEMDNPNVTMGIDERLVISEEATWETVTCNVGERHEDAHNTNEQKSQGRKTEQQAYIAAPIQQKHQSSVKESCGLSCKHECTMRISKEQQVDIHTAFWNLKDHKMQRNFIHQNCTRSQQECGYVEETSNRGYNVSYNLTVNGNDFRVCKPFFMNTLDIGEKFIRNTFKKFNEIAGLVEKNKRDVPTKREIKESLKDHIRNHIKSFPKLESPQRKGKTNRQYLPSNLSVAQMYRLYTEEMNSNNLPILKQSMYSKIFKTEFNLAFLVGKKNSMH